MSTGLVLKKSFEPLATSFLVVATTELGAVGAKRAEECFTGSRWGDNNDIGYRFPNSPRTDACVITTLAPSYQWTFADAAAAVLGVSASFGHKRLEELLIKRGKTLTLAQLEKMAESTKATTSDEYANMRIDGRPNFAFVKAKEKYYPILIVSVRHLVSGWNTEIFRPDNHVYRHVESRLVVRNLVLKR